MFTPRILSKALFSIADIGVEISAHEWVATPEYEKLVDVVWRKKLLEATHPVWDGTYYRLINIAELKKASAPKMLRLGTVRYHYIATFPSLHQDHMKYRLDALYHLSTVALVQTSDDYYLLKSIGLTPAHIQR